MSFKLSTQQWSALSVENRALRHLRMGCCDTRAIPKRSKYGTQFFAHATRGVCASALKSAEHMFAQEAIARAIDEAGWTAHVEHRHPEGRWVADVLAVRGDERIAFEVQLSHQRIDETLRRHQRYENDGIRCVWLYKQKNTAILRPPLFYLFVDKEAQSVRVVLNGNIVTIEDFVRNVLAGRRSVTGTDGIDKEIDRLNCTPLTKLRQSVRVRTELVAAIERAGATAEIDVSYRATRPKYNYDHCPVQIVEYEWTIDVVARRDEHTVAFHIQLSEKQLWEAERQSDSYVKCGKHNRVQAIWLVQNEYLYKSLVAKKVMVARLPEIGWSNPLPSLDALVTRLLR